MTRNAQDIIDDMRNIVKPRITKMLLEANFEGCGKEDKAEFETEFEIILTLTEKALEQEPILDKIRAEIGMYEADCRLSGDEYPSCKECTDNVFESIYRIIDKYKEESEVNDGRLDGRGTGED
jgi:hypothetical protein